MRLSRGGLLIAVFAAVVVTWLGPRVPVLVHDLSGPSFPEALLALGSLTVVALAGWVLIIALSAMLGVSSRVLARFTPAVLRGVLLAGATGVLAVGPAHADQVSGPGPQLPHSVNGLPLPDRPDAHASSAASRPRATPARPQERAVGVRPGDTLWAIAARSLPAGATDAQIAAATRAWHRANREVIGADPNLIFPTQRLAPPTVKDSP